MRKPRDSPGPRRVLRTSGTPATRSRFPVRAVSDEILDFVAWTEFWRPTGEELVRFGDLLGGEVKIVDLQRSMTGTIVAELPACSHGS
jgi:hypothetical protein